MATKIIKLNNGQTGTGAITYVPVTLASAVQYNTGTENPISVQEAIGTVAQSLIDVANNANGSYMSVSGSSDPTVKILTPNGTQTSSYQFKGGGNGTGTSTGHVTVSYSNGIITFGTTYTNTNYYDKITDKGLSGYQIAAITATGTSSSSALYVPKATTSHLGVVQLGYTDANKGYALKLDSNGKGYVNVPWTDTVPDYSSTYAPYAHTGTKASDTTYGHAIIDKALSSISTNAVQNKVINTALSEKAPSTHSHVITWSGSNYSPANNVSTVNVLTYFNAASTTLNNNGTANYTTVTVPTTHYVDSKIGDIGSALNFKGTVGPNETQKSLPTANVKTGDVWLVKLASGTNTSILSGQTLENGDMIIATNNNPISWTVVNANWTASDGTADVTVGASNATTLATIGGVTIDIKVAQEANVTHKSDLTSYVNGLNNSTGTGVVTGAKLETNGGGKKLTLSYTDNSSNYTGGSTLKTLTAYTQNTSGKITSVTFSDIATMKAATASDVGTKGFVPAPPANSLNKVLTGAATFKTISALQGNHTAGLLYKTMDTTENFTLFDDSAFTGAAVSLATIASPSITVSLS